MSPERFSKVAKHITCKCLLDFLTKCQRFIIYSATIGVGIVAAALILSPSIPGPLHPILGNSYFALASAMACKVFRSLKVGTLLEENSTILLTTTSPMFVKNPHHTTTSAGPLEVQVNVQSESDCNKKNPQNWPYDHASRV